MAKRKLNRRQSWRIKKIQEERTERANKRDSQIEEQVEGGDLGPEQHGLIISHFGRQVDVEASEGERQGEIIRCHMRSNLGQLVTGDKVVWRQGPQAGVVVACLPRHSELVRPNPYGDIKPVAANIDQIVVTIAVEPHPHANLIDRYLVAAELCGIEPVLLVNKSDLLDEERSAQIASLMAPYEALGYRIIYTSSATEQGLKDLKAELNQRISVFVGQSGVGKSSLINALLPGADIKVGELSESTRKGRHTTTTARLFHFPEGGDLIDSPGIREFGLWHIEADKLINGFRELRDLEGYCRFRDCKHDQEPGCAIKDALEQNEIHPLRWQSYQRILASLDE
ncbi:MAG: small ribosomal subunit biogenesis GTPase RsgA [Pontibacterium sp.]